MIWSTHPPYSRTSCTRCSRSSYTPCVLVAQWLEHCVSSAKVVGSIPREHTYWQYKCIAWMHCKSLWIKASAKCINVNVHCFVIVYINDILIYSRSLAEYHQHVAEVLQHLKEHHLYLKAEKCSFNQSSTQFLGYNISEHSIQRDVAAPMRKEWLEFFFCWDACW